MSRTIPIALAQHIAGGRLTLAMCCKATRTDGVIFGFTELDLDLTIGGVLYYAGALGFTLSATEGSDQLAPDNHEVAGILSSAGITHLDIRAGKWDACKLEFFQVNYRSIGDGTIPETVGEIGDISPGSLTFKVEFLDVKQRLAQNLLRTVSPICDAIFGDARCKYPVETLRVTSAAQAGSTDRLIIDSARTEPDGHWNGGNVTMLTGPSAGLKMEVKRSLAVGSIELVLPFFYGIAPTDGYTMTPGCDHQKKVNGAYTGDCVARYDNAINFRGFDDVPGTDATTAYGQ